MHFGLDWFAYRKNIYNLRNYSLNICSPMEMRNLIWNYFPNSFEKLVFIKILCKSNNCDFVNIIHMTKYLLNICPYEHLSKICSSKNIKKNELLKAVDSKFSCTMSPKSRRDKNKIELNPIIISRKWHATHAQFSKGWISVVMIIQVYAISKHIRLNAISICNVLCLKYIINVL